MQTAYVQPFVYLHRPTFSCFLLFCLFFPVLFVIVVYTRIRNTRMLVITGYASAGAFLYYGVRRNKALIRSRYVRDVTTLALK